MISRDISRQRVRMYSSAIDVESERLGRPWKGSNRLAAKAHCSLLMFVIVLV